MKSLVESLNEYAQIDESAVLASALATLAACSAAFGLIMHNNGDKNDVYYADTPRYNGIITWLVDKSEDIMNYFRNKGIDQAIKKIQDSDEYKEWLNLPKNKRTLKRLEEIAKKVVGDDVHFAAINSIWTDYKKEYL